MLGCMAIGVAIAEILYIISSFWREELSFGFVLLLSFVTGVLSCVQILS